MKINLTTASGAARRGLITALVFVALVAVYMTQLWLHAVRTSATYDEPYHLLAGHRYIKCGDFGINPEHPPLVKILAALPIAGRELVDTAPCGSQATSKDDGFKSGAKFVADNGVDRILTPARIAASLMSLLLAVILFFAAWEMFGRIEAFVALVLLVFEPNLIAHGSLVTTDMAITATMLGAVYALYRYRKQPSRWRLLVTGLAVGLALASKHSGLFVASILFLLLILDALFLSKTEDNAAGLQGRRILRGAAAFASIILVGFILLWASYGFRQRALPNSSERVLPPIAELVSSPGAVAVLGVVARLLPEAYAFGIVDIIDQNQGHEGEWLYFPRAFVIKSSVALLVLLPFGLFNPGLYRNHKREMLFLLLPALTFFGMSLMSSLNIGVRHLLPVYPFFIILAAAGACAVARKIKIAYVAIAALLLFHAFSTIRTAPNYIAFSNAFFGGADNTYRHLHDSNVDWGQSLKFVTDYVRQNGGGDCWFAYFGPGEVARVSQPCHLMPAVGWNETSQAVEIIPPVIEGLVFISTEAHPPHDTAYEVITNTEPIATLGGSVKVYKGRFEIPFAAATSHMGVGRALINAGRFEEAIVHEREAVRLSPEHPHTHLVLGEALAGAGKLDEARQAFEESLRIAEPHGDLYQVQMERARKGLEGLKATSNYEVRK